MRSSVQGATKVGDTLTANVTPAKATNVTYAWYTGDSATALNTQIADATTKDLTVTADMIGKFVGVVVTGDNNSTANAVTAVAVAEAEAEKFTFTAKQVGAKKVELEFSKTPSTPSVVVKKGSSNISQSILATNGNKVVLEFGSNLVAGDYTVEVTNGTEKADATFTAEGAKLDKVEFANTNLAVSSNTTDGMKKAYAAIVSEDQWGNHMNLTGATFTVSKESSHSFNAESGILTVNAPSTGTYAGTTYTIGETVVVTVQYTDGNTPKVVTGVLTVTLADSVKTLEFGDLTTDSVTYKDKKTTQKALQSGSYYFPVKEAISDAGVKLDVDQLNEMIQSNDNPGGTLFINPNSTAKASAYIYAGKFVAKKDADGNTIPALEINAGDNIGDLNIDLDYSITVASQSGLSKTLTVGIKRNPVIDTITMTVPTLAANVKSEITMTAVDQYGDPFDFYDKVTVNPVDNKVTIADATAVGSRTNFIIGTAATCAVDITKDSKTKTTHIYVTPATKGYINISGTTAGFKAISYPNISVGGEVQATGISKLDIDTKLSTTATAQDFTSAKIKFTGDNSAEMTVGMNEYPSYSKTLLNVGTQRRKGAANATYPAASYTIANEVADASLAAGSGNGQDVTAAAGVYVAPTVASDDGTAAYAEYVWSAKMTDGKVVDATNSGTAEEIKAHTVAPTSTLAYVGDAVVLDKDNQKLYVAPGAVTGSSDTIRIILYKVTLNADGATLDIAEQTHKDFTFTTVAEADQEYKLVLDEDGRNKLFSGSVGTDVLKVKLTTVDGAAVDQSKLTAGNITFATENNDNASFKYDGTRGGIVTTAKVGDGEKVFKATMTATFATETTKTATASLDFYYTQETPKAQGIGIYEDSDHKDLYTSTEMKNTVNGVVDKASNGDQLYIWVPDQYGNDITTDWVDSTKDAVTAKVTYNQDGSKIAGAKYTNTGLNLIYTTDVVAGKKATIVLSSNGYTQEINLTTVATTNGSNSEAAAATKSISSIMAPSSTLKYGDNATGVVMTVYDNEGNEVTVPTYAYKVVHFADSSSEVAVTAGGTDEDYGLDLSTPGTILYDATVGTTGLLADKALAIGDKIVVSATAAGYTGSATRTFTVAQAEADATTNKISATLSTSAVDGQLTATDEITFAGNGTTNATTTILHSDIKAVTVIHNGGEIVLTKKAADSLIWKVPAGAATLGATDGTSTKFVLKVEMQGNFTGTTYFTATKGGNTTDFAFAQADSYTGADIAD